MNLGIPHPSLLQYLPTHTLKAVHLLTCNLRGRHWGSQRPCLLFVSRHSFDHLLSYHRHVLHELRCRGFRPSPKWSDPSYRGRRVDPWPLEAPRAMPTDLWYQCHTPTDYRASLAHLRQRANGARWTENDRLRITLAPEVVR